MFLKYKYFGGFFDGMYFCSSHKLTFTVLKLSFKEPFGALLKVNFKNKNGLTMTHRDVEMEKYSDTP